MYTKSVCRQTVTEVKDTSRSVLAEMLHQLITVLKTTRILDWRCSKSVGLTLQLWNSGHFAHEY